ncbi:hypothetical protein MMA231_01654 [Asticcacaulis sp. MM231]|uniref:Tad domain-containing protein n=1 Tax=Asticcacaulis sp. MM231 TaxID=3157666 RepID=UPI0032D5707C
MDPETTSDRARGFFSGFLKNLKGNVSLTFGLSFVFIVTAIGGALDLHRASSARHDLQDAVDSAVLAGVQVPAGQMKVVASTTFTHNIDASNAAQASQGYSSSASSSSTSSTNIVTTSLNGTAKLNSKNYVLQLVGLQSIPVTASSTAKAVVTETKTATPCIYVLDPTGSQALLVNSGARISAPNCEIDVKTLGKPAGMFNSGSSLTFKKVCMEGSQVTQNSTTVANLSLNCTNQADPYAGKMPTPASSTCNFSNGNYNDSTVNLTPGVYCGWFNFNNGSAKVNFAPGVYIIKNGGWNVNGGTWTGNGVTFYFADTSKIQFNSGISATLSAPTSGTYKDLLFYEAAGLSKSDFIFNNSVANKLTGVIWLPSRTVTWNAASGVASDSLTMVVWRLILNNTTWSLNPLSTGTTATGAKTVSVLLVK